jgi:hypothetical protein
MKNEDKAIFDCRGIGQNDVVFFMKDGKRIRVDKKQYFKESDRELKIKTEDINVREPIKVKRPGTKRSGPTSSIKHKQGNSRRVATGKRVPVLPLIY